MSARSGMLGSIIIAPFSKAELERFRRHAGLPPRYEDLIHAAQRLQVLRTLRAGSLDREASAGAARIERAALSELARCPAPSRSALRMKEQLFASAEPGHDDNLEAMLAASIAVDRDRLAAAGTGAAAPPPVRPVQAVRRAAAGLAP